MTAIFRLRRISIPLAFGMRRAPRRRLLCPSWLAARQWTATAPLSMRTGNIIGIYMNWDLDEYLMRRQRAIFVPDVRVKLAAFCDLAVTVMPTQTIFADNGASTSTASHGAIDFTMQGLRPVGVVTPTVHFHHVVMPGASTAPSPLIPPTKYAQRRGSGSTWGWQRSVWGEPLHRLVCAATFNTS